MNRRSFLAAGATLAAGVTGGCTGCARIPTAKVSMEATTDEEIAVRATRSEDLDPSTDRYEFVRRVIENGPITVEDTEPRYPENRPFVFDGGVYRLSYEIVDSEPATSYRFTLESVDGEVENGGVEKGGVEDGESIRYEELPEVDRRNLAERGLDDPEIVGFSSSILYTREERSESVLVPEPEYAVVVWDEDTRGRWTVDRATETPLKTYRYGSEVVHESAAAYGATLREEYAFELSGLSEAERDIVTQAIDAGGYRIAPDESPPDAFWTLAERFGRRDEFRRPGEDGGGEGGDGENGGDEGGNGKNGSGEGGDDESEGDEDGDDDTPVSGTYLVRYEGTVYWTRVRAPARETTTDVVG